MRVLRWLAFLWVMVECLSAANAPGAAHHAAPAAQQPNIVLITLDTVRADRMGFLGSRGGLTPNLDVIAQGSVVFERAYSQVPLTTPSHATIFTGTYPQFNHLNYMGQPLGEELPYLPELLHRRGYRTAAFVGSFVLDANDPVAAGFGRGFDTYDADFHQRRGKEDRYQSLERRAETVVSHALTWLDTHRRKPFFLWVHCYDPHAPYDPPEPFKSRYSATPYEGEIAYTDSAMGKLFEGLRTRGLFDSALIALMADHGEALGDHGELHHGMFLYDETIHVPLLLKLPKGQQAGSRVPELVRLVDVAPTILQEVGAPVPKTMQGESLLSMMKATSEGSGGGANPAAAERAAYAESDYAQLTFGWSALRAWRTSKHLYVDAPERELYDQTSDPQALHNTAADSKAVADTMQSQIDAFRHKTATAATERTQLSPEQAETLGALGYLAATSGAKREGGDRGPDPKAKRKIASLFEEALGATEDNDFPTAISKLQQVIQEDPGIALAYLQLGGAYLSLKDYPKALPLLRTAAEKLPDYPSAHYQLGEALARTGDWTGAVRELEKVVASLPMDSQVHMTLGVAYQQTKQIPQAMREFRSTLELKPDNFGANLMLGRLLGMQGAAEEALPYLRKAVQLKPNSRDAHLFLANVYDALGQTANAERERAAGQHGEAAGHPE